MTYLLRRPATVALGGLMMIALFCRARPAVAIGRRVDLAAMTQQAGTIVSGRIIGLREGRHPRYRNIRVLNVTVQVSQMIKGAAVGRFSFMQFAGLHGSERGGKRLSMAQSLPDLPAYRVGEEVVLFLYAPSNVGFTSPVGGNQGMFLVRRSSGQPATVISEGGNQSLAVERPISSHLSASQARLLQHPGGTLDYKTFLETVKSLVKNGH